MNAKKSFISLIVLLFVFSSYLSFGQAIGTPPDVIGNKNICLLSSAPLYGSDPTGTPDATFQWEVDLVGLGLVWIPLQTSDSIVLQPTVSTNYRVRTINPSNSDVSAYTYFTVSVDLLSQNIDVVTGTANPAIICNGESAVFTPFSTFGNTVFRWYDAAVGGNLLYEGTGDYTAPSLDLINTIFVSSLDGAGCESPRILAVPPVVIPALSVPVGLADPLTICSGDESKLYTLNKPGGNTVNWYSDLLGGTALATNQDTFLLDQENTTGASLPITRYAEFEDANGCRSIRTPVVVTVLPGLDVPTVLEAVKTICTGDSASFTATSLLGGATFHWYDALLGGNLLHTGATFNTGPIENAGATDLTRMYYVSVEDGNGCESIRFPVTVLVTPALDLPLVQPLLPTSCPGDSVTFEATSLLGGTTFHWYDNLLGGNHLHTGSTFNTGALENLGAVNLTRNYFVEVEDANGCRSLRSPASVLVLPALDVPTYMPLAPIICSGDSVELTASSLTDLPNYHWYDQIDATVPVHTGDVFNTGALVSSGPTDLLRVFYLEGENAEGCRTLRIPVTITLRPALDLPLVDPLVPPIVCEGDSVEFTASSLLGSGVTYNWYNSLTGGTLLHTGATFNTGPLNNESGLELTKIYYVEVVDGDGCKSLRLPATAIIRPAIDVALVMPPAATVCDGDSAEFVATSLLGSDATFHWYDALLGGNLLASGDTFNTGALNNTTGTELLYTYYAEVEDTAGCRSLRTPVIAAIVPALDLPIITPPVQVVCNNQSAEFVATSLLGNTEFRWYDALLGGNLLHVGDTFNTGPLVNASGTDLTFMYYAEVVDSNGCKSLRLPATAIIRPNLDVPVPLPPVATVCNGGDAEFIATSVGNLLGQDVTFNWYDALLGGNLIFTGDTFQTPTITNTTGTDLTEIYYLEAQDTAGCQSIRVPATLIVLPALDLPLVNPPLAVVCAGDSTEFVATSLLGSASEYHWYDALLGGNEIFTGDTFNTGPVTNANVADVTRIYYVELEDTAGCRSLRLPVTQIIRPSLALPLVLPPVAIVCQGDSAEFVASSPIIEADFRWYDALTGGNLIHEGDTLNTGPIVNATGTELTKMYYVEAVDTAGCVSLIRNFGTAIIQPALDLPIVSPLTQTVCSGGQATLTATSLLGSAMNIRWYDALVGGNELFVGDTFVTQVSSNGSGSNTTQLFYAEVEDTAGCRSLRVPGTVIITPGLTAPTVTPAFQAICSGGTATIIASSDIDTTQFTWFDALFGGNELFVGDTFVTDTLYNFGATDSAVTFYVEERDTINGECASIRIPSTVLVSASPNAPVIENPNNVICSGETVTFIASAPDTVPGEISWYNSETSTTAIFVGDTFTTDPLVNNGSFASTFSFFAEFRDSSGCVSQRARGNATIRPFLDTPTANPSNQNICSGGDAQAAGVSNSPTTATFNWYDDASGETPIFTGDTLKLSNLQNNTNVSDVRTFYVQSVDSAGCLSALSPFTVTIEGASEPPTTSPSNPTICTGSTVTITATSNQGPGSTYYWYAEIGDENPIFVGEVYTTEVMYNFDGSLTQEDYYVQVEDSIGCTSNLSEIVVTVETNGDDVSAFLDESPVCHGNTATLNGMSNLNYTDFKWYAGSTDISPVFEGDPYETAPLFGDTTIYVSSFNGDCSSARFPVFIPTQELSVLDRPEVTCVENGDGEKLTFAWSAVAGATNYEVSTDGGVTWMAPSNIANLMHEEFKTNDDDKGVRLVVRAQQIGNACSDEYSPISMEVYCPFAEFGAEARLHNSFSPNGDGVNDYWYITDGLEALPDNHVIIYNRWGQEVFETTGYDNDQNVFKGEDLEDGAYFYVISIPSKDFKKTGYVMIIR